MPDITMCGNDENCPIANTCKRSEKSGTQPNKFIQSWALFKYSEETKGCANYWNKIPKINPKQQGA